MTYSNTTPNAAATPEFDQVDLDQGTQPADINSIGTTASRFPAKKVAFFGVVAVIVLGGLFMLGKYWVGEKWADRPKAAKGSANLSPSEGAQSINKPQLPDSNTPLEGSTGSTYTLPTQTGSRAVHSGGQTTCPSTALVDKRTGQAVRDSQGQSVMVDCHGVIQGATRVPAPQPIGGQVVGAPMGQTPAAASDRYSGDTSLTRKSAQSALPGSLPAMGGLTPPPVSSSDLEARLKKLMTPTAQATVPTNPILAAQSTAPANPQESVGGMLSPTATPKAMAVRSFDPNLTIPKGDAINCAMTTRVVTEISGFTSCIVTEHVYSANGRVLLIERMSEIQGEYTAVGQPGQRRVYVLWSRVRKPGAITIDIASPSTDSLGAAGIDGVVDNRWFERIGSAYMLSIFKDFLAAKSAGSAGLSGTQSGAALFQNSISTSSSIAEKVLEDSMKIKPVVYAHQGERISIYVARDLDFSGVYQVTPVNQP